LLLLVPGIAAKFRYSYLTAALLFVLSGALGLGYQLVWIRKAALIVGASQIALATVLTSFFLGLGLASIAVGRYLRSQRWSPLFVYGLFEAAIGIFALAFPMLFELVEAGYGGLYPLFRVHPIALFLLRFGLLFLLFLVPTFFMGGTLPLLLDGLVERDESVGSLTSLLYGLNIVGAVVGVLATGYFAIPLLGMNGTSRAAGIGNLAIAVTAMTLFGGTRPLHPRLERSESTPRLPWFFAAMGFASGLAAIGLPPAWRPSATRWRGPGTSGSSTRGPSISRPCCSPCTSRHSPRAAWWRRAS
jgi:predicted membrane-bound spermidine synthase